MSATELTTSIASSTEGTQTAVPVLSHAHAQHETILAGSENAAVDIIPMPDGKDDASLPAVDDDARVQVAPAPALPVVEKATTLASVAAQATKPAVTIAMATPAPVAAAAAAYESDSDIEFIHIIRKSKTKDEREEAKGGRPGNQGRFSEDMNTYLESFRARYEDIREMRLGKNKALRRFWYDLRTSFWERFTWRDIRETWGDSAEKWSKAQCMRAANNVSNKQFL